MNSLLENIVSANLHHASHGHVATYIPQLAKVNPNQLGIYISTEEEEDFFAGDCFVPFTMQSVVKPLILLQALMDSGENAVRTLVGVEATGKPFDTFNYSDQALQYPWRSLCFEKTLSSVV